MISTGIYEADDMTKRVLLTMSDELYEELQKKRTERGYLTAQEYINEIVRQKVLVQPAQTDKGKPGRPKKSEDPYLDHFSKKR